jgi:polyisoprenoid-binding protein YceI
MKKPFRFYGIFATLCLLPTLPALAQTLQAVPQDKINVVFVFKQMGAPVEGKFKSVKANVAFDPTKPWISKAEFEISTDSIDIGLPELDAEVKKIAWFNTAKFPKASFVSSYITPKGGTNYDVRGRLTIKGITKDISMPANITQKANGTSEAVGTLTIKRLDYKLGEGTWSDTSTVTNDVQIKVTFPIPSASPPKK